MPLDSRLSLSDVTLVSISNVESELTAEAIRECSHRVDFGGAVHIIPESLSSYEEVLWYDAIKHITTSHALIIQYDSWILDASMWRDEWLQYDYIGAVWPWHSNNRVGNGGFSLRSKKLMQFLALNPYLFPLMSPEDNTLCRVHRRGLEEYGFKWAPESVATKFSFERELPHATFGFHGIFNWRHVLSKDAFDERVALAKDHVKSKPEWRELMAVA